MDAVVSMFAGIVQRIDDALRPHVTIEPLQPPPPFDPVAFQAQVEVELRRLEDEEAARPLLPSTDYRTNPRPVQMPAHPRT